MDTSASVLGATTSKYLAGRSSEIILKIGSDHFTRRDLARVGCYNFLAAANLDRILQKETIAVANTKALFEAISPRDLVLPDLGAITLAVLGAAFEARHVGGASPLASWYARHLKDDAVTFASLKQRPAREEEARRPRKLRRAS